VEVDNDHIIDPAVMATALTSITDRIDSKIDLTLYSAQPYYALGESNV